MEPNSISWNSKEMQFFWHTGLTKVFKLLKLFVLKSFKNLSFYIIIIIRYAFKIIIKTSVYTTSSTTTLQEIICNRTLKLVLAHAIIDNIFCHISKNQVIVNRNTEYLSYLQFFSRGFRKEIEFISIYHDSTTSLINLLTYMLLENNVRNAIHFR